jgi:hypothetical protein
MDTKKLPEEKEKKILKEAVDRLKKAIDFDAENRKAAYEDLEFVAVEGKQWPDHIRTEREGNSQPCLTINKLPTFIDQVVGDQRMNRPSIRVVPVDSDGDPKVARVYSGWIKHVEQISNSDVAIDHAFEHAVTCGYGALRVVTNYVSDMSFEQEAYIEKIDNALAVFWGRHTKYDCSDAEFCFVVTDMDKEEFKDKYGEDNMPSFDSANSQYVEGWATKDTIRLAEYFVKEYKEMTIYLLQNGKVVEKLEEGQVAVKSRKTRKQKIMWYLLSGKSVIDSREWAGKKYIPIIPVWGKEFNVGGKRIVRGMVRNGKDSQRMYNYWSSIDTEIVALQPRNPFILTPKMIEDHAPMWNQAGKKNMFYLLINPDKEAPGVWPHREPPPQASSAMVQKIAMVDQELRDTIGLQKAALGMQSNERSGVAIRERKQEGEVGTFAFMDNLARTVEHIGRVLIDIAPVILDTERVVRLGLDNGDFDFDAVNVKTKDGRILNDLSVGIYDVVVTVGPSFTTQRTEARQSMQEYIQYYPAAAPVIGDLYARSLDWPGAEEIAERLETLLPPEIKAKKAADKARKEGLSPEQAAQANPLPAPDPLMILKVKQEEMKLQELQLQVQQEQEKLKGLKLENDLKVATTKEGVSQMLDEIITEKIGGDNAKGNES